MHMGEHNKANREEPPTAEEEGKPEAPDWLFENITEASKLARRIYLVYISFLLYTAVTAAGITDRQLLLNENVTLPILKTTMPLTGFCVLAPLVCLFLYLYFQLYVHRIDGIVGQLEADYSPLPKRRLYPWMINIAANPEPGMMGHLQRIVVDLSGWALLLSVLYLFWFSVRRGQHRGVTLYVGVIVLIALTLWLMLHTAKRRRIMAEKQTARRFRFSRITSFRTAGIVILLFLFVTVSMDLLALFGKESLVFFGPFRKHYDFSFQSLSSQPSVETELPYWLYLRLARLQGARLLHTNLRRTDLSHARLTRAQGDSANFTGCNFFSAWLDQCTFRGTLIDSVVLDSAILRASDLSQAKIRNSSLKWADMRDVNLSYANLRGSDLYNAVLDSAILLGADLSFVKNLTADMLSKTKTLYQATIDYPVVDTVLSQYPHLFHPYPDSTTQEEKK